MKNIHEILKEYELEVPADKKAAFDKTWKENYWIREEYSDQIHECRSAESSIRIAEIRKYCDVRRS